MRLLQSLPQALLLSVVVSAQVTTTGSSAGVESTIPAGDAPPSSERSYQSYASTRTVDNTDTSSYGSMSAPSSSMGASNATGSATSRASTSTSVTLLVGGQRTTATLNGTISANATSSRSSTTPQPTNTTPCNGHPSFCFRKYSNITQVGAHNSPFVRPGNAASNQALDVRYQLEDGIRMRKPSFPFADLLLLTRLQSNSKPTGTKPNKQSTSATRPATSLTSALSKPTSQP
jgi:hypothetical protein